MTPCVEPNSGFSADSDGLSYVGEEMKMKKRRERKKEPTTKKASFHAISRYLDVDVLVYWLWPDMDFWLGLLKTPPQLCVCVCVCVCVNLARSLLCLLCIPSAIDGRGGGGGGHLLPSV